MNNRIVLHLSIDGKPEALNRPRFRRCKNKVMCYNSQASDENTFKKNVFNQLTDDEKQILDNILKNNLTTYVSIKAVFYIKIQQTGSKLLKQQKADGIIRPTSRPDVDNYIKFVLDSLHGVIYNDDSCVTDVSGAKRYAENPKTELEITIVY